MNTIDHPEATVWYIAREGDIVHTGFVCPDTRMSTQLANVETFTSESEWTARLSELGITTPEGNQ